MDQVAKNELSELEVSSSSSIIESYISRDCCFLLHFTVDRKVSNSLLTVTIISAQ